MKKKFQKLRLINQINFNNFQFNLYNIKNE